MAASHRLQRVGIAWIERQRMLKFLQGKIMISGKLVDSPQSHIGDGEAIIQFRCLLAIRLGFVKPLRIYFELVLQSESFTELGITEREAWVRVDGYIKRTDGAIEVTGLVVALH